MTTYSTLEELPDTYGSAALDRLIARLKAQPELAFLQQRVLPHDISSLVPENSPCLCVVKVGDNIARTAVGKAPPHNLRYCIGMRLYLHYPGGGTAVWLTQQTLLERANGMLLKVLRQQSYICDEPYWKQLEAEDPGPFKLSSVFGFEAERMYMQSNVWLLRHARPGN